MLDTAKDILVFEKGGLKEGLGDKPAHIRFCLLEGVEKLDHIADLLVVHHLLKEGFQHHQRLKHEFNLLQRY